jgi:hypothetical protein
VLRKIRGIKGFELNEELRVLHNKKLVGFELLTVVVMKSTVFLTRNLMGNVVCSGLLQ